MKDTFNRYLETMQLQQLANDYADELQLFGLL